MQSVRSRIWTRVAVSISCDDNHYTTGTSHISLVSLVIISILSRYLRKIEVFLILLNITTLVPSTLKVNAPSNNILGKINFLLLYIYMYIYIQVFTFQNNYSIFTVNLFYTILDTECHAIKKLMTYSCTFIGQL